MGETKCANDANVVGLDKNCMSCANTQNNEATLKAFKIACLSYHPSKVQYERTDYSRAELIVAKQALMNHALGQLRHLDLGSTDHIGVSSPINPKHVPRLPATTDNLMCSSIYSVEGSQANPIIVPRLNLKERTQ